jgi:hypothetical protein
MNTFLLTLFGSIVLLAVLIWMVKAIGGGLWGATRLAIIAIVAIPLFIIITALTNELLPHQWALANNVSLNGAVSLGTSAEITNIFDGGGTIELWVSPNGVGGGGNGRAIGKAQWSLACQDELSNACRIRFQQNFDGGADGSWRTNDRVLAFGAANHVAIVYDNSSAANNPIFYVNEVPVAFTETITPIGTRRPDGANDLVMLNRGTPGLAWDGWIDDVRLWDDVRTASELSVNKFLTLTGSESGLVGYWPMSEGTGTTTADATANGNDGTISGVEWIRVQHDLRPPE